MSEGPFFILIRREAEDGEKEKTKKIQKTFGYHVRHFD